MKKSYEERQAECKLKVGDKVRILRKAEGDECGRNGCWVLEMDRFVEKIGEIIRDNNDGWLRVFCEELRDSFWFPYSSLEKVEDNETSKNEEGSKNVEKSYEERQRECGLKVGDKVKILRKVDDYADGWDNEWPEEADTWIGKIGSITGGKKADGFKVYLKEENDWWFFPYFVLEKVEDNETPKHVEPVKQEEKKLTNYSVFTTQDHGEEFFFFAAISKEENNESIIFTEENGGTWEFYKKHIVAIKKA